MSDILTRLREWEARPFGRIVLVTTITDAADEIARLRTALAILAEEYRGSSLHCATPAEPGCPICNAIRLGLECAAMEPGT